MTVTPPTRISPKSLSARWSASASATRKNAWHSVGSDKIDWIVVFSGLLAGDVLLGGVLLGGAVVGGVVATLMGPCLLR